MDPPAPPSSAPTVESIFKRSALKASESPLKFSALEKKRHHESEGTAANTPPTAETFEFRPEPMEPDHCKLAEENQDLKHQILAPTTQLTNLQASMTSEFANLSQQPARFIAGAVPAATAAPSRPPLSTAPNTTKTPVLKLSLQKEAAPAAPVAMQPAQPAQLAAGNATYAGAAAAPLDNTTAFNLVTSQERAPASEAALQPE